ncbi:uncharacterized protein SAMN02745157_0407 [Kaistia soli DSM 19436]|uniref:HD/PDEase domain-containing protein n=1 Tax=Kaistia soli DSM 19436 TaxID=1122133 RepID=A0A1M4UCM6_9HYPH|nr:HD domain-containing protein [Kaistia soli]SHE54485.1 uncharacterized protein SAMN02745157_0407 [Kaistia soli DSM 19436]
MTPVELGRASERFGQEAALAALLLPHSVAAGDGAHDIAHILRVWKAADAIHAIEGGDRAVLAAAVLLHDCVAVEKNAPDRHLASRLASEHAGRLLRGLGWCEATIASTGHAITAHSFSAGIAPETIEAKILQDADRLDAIGMIGVARCFYIGGRLGSALYDPFDPDAEARPLDDKRYALDHFETKLLKLSAGFNTETGRAMAAVRHARLLTFLDALASEI